jgi:Fe-S-cluster-containing dehydrogenase component
MIARRSFFRFFGAAAAAPLLPATAGSVEVAGPDPQAPAVLVDITRCVGCRACEAACGEENDRLVPDISDRSVLVTPRRPSIEQWTVVNRFETSRGELFVKRQCMHCDQPACATACLTKAMYKTPEGPIIWRGRKCMGCRFCMVSCPFDVPKFEYLSPNPRIHKCTMCWHRQVRGERPACVEACPVEALQFGTRQQLIELARQRIYGSGDKYVRDIYGEHEVAGTGWLYISPVPFEEVGFRTDLGRGSYPELTKDFLYAVPIVLVLWPAFLFGVHQATQGSEETASEAS